MIVMLLISFINQIPTEFRLKRAIHISFCRNGTKLLSQGNSNLFTVVQCKSDHLHSCCLSVTIKRTSVSWYFSDRSLPSWLKSCLIYKQSMADNKIEITSGKGIAVMIDDSYATLVSKNKCSLKSESESLN